MIPATKKQLQAPQKSLRAQDQTRPKVQPKSTPEDNRLLVRKKLVREVQSTKTEFVICPVSTEAQEKLIARMGEIEASLCARGQCKVEKPGQHAAYRLSGIPRSYAVFNGSTVELKQFDASVVADALTDLTNVPPISVLESRGSDNSDLSPKKNWTVLYPKGPTLSKILPLFGVRIPAKILPPRSRTPQCGLCFG
ncbi:hypothetical protein K3495_g9510 [Podosphaera aphanis]|nr:hypothetical protein K3495_g9510 [Podosphaera aphanis]